MIASFRALGVVALGVVLTGGACSLDYAKFVVSDEDPFSTGGAGAGASGGGATGGGATGGGATGGGATGGSGASGGGGAGAAGGGACQNTALGFDGVDDYVEVADHPALDAFGPMTIEAWVFPEALSFSQEVQILSHHHHDDHDGYVLLMLNNGGLQMRYQQNGANPQAGGGSGARLTPGKWSHVAGSYDGMRLRVFVDGEERDQTNIGQLAADDFNGPLRIGAAAYTDLFQLQGWIDEVRLSSVARYVADFAPPTEPFVVDVDTVALWHFDDGQGDIAVDATGSHHGRLGLTATADAQDPSWGSVPCISAMLPPP